MNVRRFVAKTSRDALSQVKQALGDDAVVLSTKPCAEGVEVLAMAPESMHQIERLHTPAATPGSAAAKPAPAADVQQDVEQLAMSTLSFQDYVRERMLKRRDAALKAEAPAAAAPPARAEPEMTPLPARMPHTPVLREEVRTQPPVPSLADAAEPAREQRAVVDAAAAV